MFRENEELSPPRWLPEIEIRSFDAVVSYTWQICRVPEIWSNPEAMPCYGIREVPVGQHWAEIREFGIPDLETLMMRWNRSWNPETGVWLYLPCVRADFRRLLERGDDDRNPYSVEAQYGIYRPARPFASELWRRRY